ncbi:organic cation transporter protein-like isoform X2 [Palaemon carinicauda]
MVSNKFEDLLSTLGTGKWSFLYFICDMYAELLLPAHAMNGVFLAPEVKYTCVPPDQPSVAGVSEDSCMYYVNTTTAEGNTTSQSFACTDWVFDNTTYEWTLTSEFELVCGRAYLRATYQGIQMIATILTCSFLGYFCDRYGRKTMLVVTQVAHSVLCLSVVLSYNFTVILLLRFLQGCFVENVAHSLAMEVCELKWRSMVGILIALPWAFGMMAWGAVASILGNWRWLQLAAALPLFLRMGFHFFVDESPRWLILKGREDEAIAVLRKAARWNGAHLPTDERLREIFREIQLEQKVTMKKEKKEKKQLSDYIPTLLRTPKVRSITILLSSVLFTSSIVYAGLTLSGDNYSTDPFLYIVLCGVMEIPGYTVAAPLINWLGKKKPMFFFLNFCGVAVLALAFIPEDINWLIMSLAMLGKLCNSMAFMILFVYLNELFPTEVRMQGIGVGVTMTCVGGAVAPYITDYLGPILPWVPSVIFGISSIVASFLLVPLPETKGRPMLETVEALEGRGPTKDGHEPVKQDRDSTTPNDEQKQFVEA